MAVTRSPRALVPALLFVGTVVAVISSLGAPLVPAIAETMQTSLPNAQWSLTVTLLVGAVATPVVGRLGDGPHRRTVVLVVLGGRDCVEVVGPALGLEVGHHLLDLVVRHERAVHAGDASAALHVQQVALA